jgi:uncharacterized protein
MDQQTRLLWQYQQIDLQVANVEKILRASVTRKKLIQARDYIMDSQNLMKKMEADVGELRINYDSIKQRNDGLTNELNALVRAIASSDRNTSMQELERMRKDASEIQSVYNKHEHELKRIVERLDKMEANINKIAANLPKAKKDYTDLKQVFDREAAVISEEAAPFRQQLSALEGQLTPKLMQRYTNIKKTRANPLAPVRNSRCTGCNMELPSVTLKQVVESGNLMECENCGRLLFLED